MHPQRPGVRQSPCGRDSLSAGSPKVDACQQMDEQYFGTLIELVGQDQREAKRQAELSKAQKGKRTI
jgi:hypothetical protein